MNMQHLFKRFDCTPRKKGFTLVELMVSLSIFSIVMVISTGTLLIMIDINAKAQALYTSTTNLSFALDSMTREIRTGYHYYCSRVTHFGTNGNEGVGNDDQDNESHGTEILPEDSTMDDCDTGRSANFIAFTRERTAERIGYRFNSDEHSIEYVEEGDDAWVRMTSPDVYIEDFQIVVEGSTPFFTERNGEYEPNADGYDQPIMNILIKGYVNNGLDENTDFNIQTRIVQRRLDLI